MKKIFVCLLAFTSVYANPSEPIPFSKLTEHDMQEIASGLKPNTVIELPAGAIVPVQLFLEGDLLALTGNNTLSLTVQQPIYVRMEPQELQLSTDMTEWKPLEQFSCGHLSFGLRVEEDSQCIVIGSQVYKKSSQPNESTN